MAEKKTTKKKAPAKKPVAKKSKLTFDTFPFDELLKICKKDVVVAEKMQQLISDYSFEKDQAERERCITIAYGNWAKVNYDIDGDGHVDEKELDGNKHADKILKAINKKISG
jgi:hypothetical protein